MTLLHWLSIIHNGVLIAFSTWTFISLTQFIYDNGIVFKTGYYFNHQSFDNIIYYFYISKYYEFVDIFLLYLNGKQPIFLQKYHHVGAVICWYLCYVYKIDGIWIATILNSFVHMVMYFYYLCCLLQIPKVRLVKKYITSLQLCQLIPQPLCLLLYKDETYINYNIHIFFTVYVNGLVGLFILFYYNNYIIKSHNK
jgi:hypothetical protein